MLSTHNRLKSTLEALTEELTHITRLKPGMQVLDRLRYRSTVLEITSAPEETIAGMLGATLPESNQAIDSSWLVGVRNVRTNHSELTRVDCDATGYTNRFQLLHT